MLLHIYFYCRTNWILNSLVKAMPYRLHNGSQNLRKLLQKMRIVTFSWHSVDIKALLVNVDADELVWARGRCRISPPRFLAECCKRQLNQVSFVSLYFRLSTFSDLYWVCLSVFSCTVLFVSISQVIGCELWRPPPKWPILCQVGR